MVISSAETRKKDGKAQSLSSKDLPLWIFLHPIPESRGKPQSFLCPKNKGGASKTDSPQITPLLPWNENGILSILVLLDKRASLPAEWLSCLSPDEGPSKLAKSRSHWSPTSEHLSHILKATVTNVGSMQFNKYLLHNYHVPGIF